MAGCASGGRTPASDPDEVTAVRALPPDTAASTDIAGMPRGFGAAFGLADQRARRILYYQQCSAAVLGMRARGKFGAAASAPRGVYCTRTADGIPLGGVYDIDSAFTRVRRLQVIRLDGAQPKWTAALDTSAVSGLAKVQREASVTLSPQFRTARRAYAIVPVALEDGTLEAWAVPRVATLRDVVLGGEIGMARQRDGTVTRVVDHAASWKRFVVPATGVVSLRSVEPEVGGVQELLVARMLAERGRDVVVVTAAATSALVPGQDASGSRYTWQHTPGGR
jgi:hypothetical protein